MSQNWSYDDEFDFDSDYNRPEPATLHETIAALKLADEEMDAVLPANVVYRLSMLEEDTFEEFKTAWYELPATRRRWTLKILAEISESDYTITFDVIGNLGLSDPEPLVRVPAVEVLWYDMSEQFFNKLLKMARDENPALRVAAVQGLGRFIQAGELEEFDAQLAKKAQDLAAEHFRNLREAPEVRRRSLEALSHCTFKGIDDMIREAYYDDDVLMKASAVFAMGATCDEQWSNIVLMELESELPEVRFEAITAAGNLQIAEALPHLIDLTTDEDYEMRFAAVEAIGEIATQEALDALAELSEYAEDIEDDELAVAIDDALQTGYMLNGIMPLLDFMDGGSLPRFNPDDMDDIFNRPEYLN